MRNKLCLLLALVVALVTTGLPAQEINMEKLAAESDVVFRGTVRLIGTSTMALEDASNLAVVRVDQVITAPDVFKSLVGDDITVALKDRQAVKEKEQRIFFARSWLTGESIAVIELGSSPATNSASVQDIGGMVERVKAQKENAELANRLDRAQLVVAGRVVAERRLLTKGVTEHDPQWAEAEIAVSETLKGTASKRVTILYPTSNDVMWYRAPKPKVGQSGVWILHSQLTGVSAAAVGVTGPKDFLSTREIQRVKSLLTK